MNKLTENTNANKNTKELIHKLRSLSQFCDSLLFCLILKSVYNVNRIFNLPSVRLVTTGYYLQTLQDKFSKKELHQELIKSYSYSSFRKYFLVHKDLFFCLNDKGKHSNYVLSSEGINLFNSFYQSFIDSLESF